MSTATYRWNARQFAVDYDAAGPVIHPYYDEVQAAVVAALPYGASDAVSIIDLGGGSGRLAERLLTAFPAATVTVVDPSGPFLELAKERLARFGDRAQLVSSRAQESDWRRLVGPVDAIVSTSALHHLDADEKNAVFAACCRGLEPGGLFVNGDEYRPPSDATYLAYLEEWGEHMPAVAAGQTPASFAEIVDRWAERNLDGFGGERQSGDDCHETVEEQTARLYGAGFKRVETRWRERLWGVLVAAKA